MTEQSKIDADQAAFAMITDRDLAPICRSAALGGFIARRIEQLIKWGHSPETDRDHSVDFLVRQAVARLTDVLDILGKGRSDCPPERRDQLLRKIEVAGALLMAEHDLISALPIPPQGASQ